MDDEIAILLSPKTYDMPEDEAWKKVKGKVKNSVNLPYYKNSSLA